MHIISVILISVLDSRGGKLATGEYSQITIVYTWVFTLYPFRIPTSLYTFGFESCAYISASFMLKDLAFWYVLKGFCLCKPLMNERLV